MVDGEIENLRGDWRRASSNVDFQLVEEVLSSGAAEVDPFDIVQLAEVIRTCRNSSSLSAAGRKLFVASRAIKRSRNDADRLRKYLAKIGLSWELVSK